MPNTRTIEERDMTLEDGDPGFIGVNERDDPAILEPGMAARAVNMRFRYQTADTRRGIVKAPLTAAVGNFPWTADGASYKADWTTVGGADALVFSTSEAGFRAPFTNLQGAGTFYDPNGGKWILIAANGAVYRTRPGDVAQEVSLNGESITGLDEVSFLQAFDKVLLFRGDNMAPLECSNLDEGFDAIAQSASGDYADTIPNAKGALFCQGRVFIPHGRDLIAASLPLDYTRTRIFDEFRINVGSGDRLLTAVKYGEQSIIALKEHSVYQLVNVYGDLADVGMNELTSAYGIVGRRAVVNLGGDVWFFSPRGVESLTQTAQSKVQGLRLPESAPIQPVIDRINWRYASAIVGATWDSKVYWAVPLDGATVNNALIVFDGITGKWCGYDTSDAFSAGIFDFVQYDWLGRERLFAVTWDGFLNVLEEGATDDVYDNATTSVSQEEIATTLVTRGYRCGTDHLKRFTRMHAVLSTWNPTFSIEGLSQRGEISTSLAANVTKDRTRSYRYGAGVYDWRNSANNHGDDNRQNYSVPVDSTGFYLGAAGINFDRMQQHHESRRLPVRDKAAQIRFTNTQGRLTVKSVDISAVGDNKADGVKP